MPIENLIFEFVSLLLGAIVLWKLWSNPNKFHFFGFIIAIVMTTVVELTGVRETFSYHYGDFVIFIPALDASWLTPIKGTGRDVPLFVSVDWAIIFFCFWRLGERLNTLRLSWYMIPLVFGLIAVFLDLGLDPIASLSRKVLELKGPCTDPTLPPGAAQGVGYWVWCIAPVQTEDWLGVPLANSYGWFLVVAVFSYFYFAAHRFAGTSPPSTQLAALLGALVVSLAVFFTLLKWLLDLNLLTPGWVLLGGLIGAGAIVLAKAGWNRTDYSIDWWALIAVVTISALSVGTYFYRLQVNWPLIIVCGASLIVSLVLTMWVMIGKRLIGQPYP